MLAKSPGFTLAGGLILALGIGANTAIFNVVDAVLLRSLPFREPAALVSVKDDLRGLNIPDVGMSVPELWDFRDRSGVFDEISAVWPISANLTGGDRPERIEVLAVSWNYFHLLGAQARIGRVFDRHEDTAGFAEGAVLSDSCWRRLFGGDPEILGRKLRIDNDLYTVVGVLPPDFRHPGRTLQGDVEMWITAGFFALPFQNPPQRNMRMLPGAIGRLKPGLTVEQARAKLETFASRLSQQFPNEYPGEAKWTPRLVPLQEDLVAKARPMLFVVLGAVGFVLLICSVSLANLVLARSSARQRETAVRLALGASRFHLIRLLMSESILLSLLGGVAGLLLVLWLRPLLVVIAPATLPRIHEVSLNWTVLLFCLGISLLTGFAFGLAPAIQLSSSSLAGNLKEGSRGSSGGRKQHRFRSSLVACEVALSLILMTGAGLLLRSFWNLLQVNPGFNLKNVLIASIWMPAPNDPKSGPYFERSARTAFVHEVLRRARSLPGVEVAAMGGGNSIPLIGWNTLPIQLEDRLGDTAPVVQTANVSPEFFQALEIPLMRGRALTDSDSQPPGVVLVDETAARRFWPNQDPLNKRVKVGQNPQMAWRTVAGVVGDIKTEGLDAASVPHLYIPIYQQPGFAMTVFLRTSSNPANLGEALRREIQNVDRNLPVFGIQTMEQVLAASIAQRRFALVIVGAFAMVALLLAGIGIYGVTAYSVSQRAQEIGIRLALGAQRRDVLSLVLVQGMTTTLWGLAGGLVGALVLTRFLRSLLFAESPLDPITFLMVALVLAGAALLACYVPALRAMRVDPVQALRCE
jgi:putative ABC transport system permease protein